LFTIFVNYFRKKSAKKFADSENRCAFALSTSWKGAAIYLNGGKIIAF